MKKLLSFFLAAVMALGALAVPGLTVFAEEPEYLPTPAPENLAWDGAVAQWELPSALKDIEEIEYSLMYVFTLYKLGAEDTPAAVFNTTLYYNPRYDAAMLIAKNGPGKYYFTVAARVFDAPGSEPAAVSPTVEFSAENAPKPALPAPALRSWKLTCIGGVPYSWDAEWTYTNASVLASDAKYHFHLKLYIDDEMITETDAEIYKTEYNFEIGSDIPEDCDGTVYIVIKAVPDEDETRYSESAEASGRSYYNVVPKTLLERKLINLEMELCRAGDTTLHFSAGWSGAYARCKYMFIRLKITSADEEHTVTERGDAYWTLNSIQGGRQRFNDIHVNYTFKAGDFVEWEIYLTDTTGSPRNEYANVSGSFTVEEGTDHTVILDAQGKAENITVTVPDRTALSNAPGVTEKYPTAEGYRLLGWSTEKKPEKEYVYADVYYGTITEDTTLYAIWKPVIDTAEVTVSTLKCGDEITVARNRYVPGYRKQSPLPTVTVPEDAPYDVSSTYFSWQTYVSPAPDPEADPGAPAPAPRLTLFEGKVMGGESYYFSFYLSMPKEGDEDCRSLFADKDKMKITGNIASAEILDAYAAFSYSEINCLVRVTAEHDWSDWTITAPPTATDKGEAARTCRGCGETETKELPANPHVLTLVPEKAPTCTEPGNKAYYTCAECDKLFADLTAQTEVKLSDVLLPAAGHAWGDWAPLNDAQHKRVCAADASHTQTADHTWDKGKVTKKATETAAGEKTFTCTACGKTKTEPIPALQPAFMLGDVNGNGEVTTADARLALRAAIGLDTYNAGTREFLAADVTEDKAIGTADARFILRHAIGLEDPQIKW